MDLGFEKFSDLRPVAQMVHLILQQAVLDGADRIEFRLVDESSNAGFQVVVRTQVTERNLPLAPGSFFSLIIVLCNHASVPYYAKGRVTGKMKTENPASEWVLESDDLRQRLLLSKT